MKFRNIVYFSFIFLASCNNGKNSDQQIGIPKIVYYSSGKLKSKKMVNMLGQKIGIAEEYYERGQLKIKYAYNNDTLNGEFESYFESGGVESKGFFWNGKPIGPAVYYKKNGKVRLYNEFDFNGDVYYVKKYDDSQKVIKEEGVPVSPNILINGTRKDSLVNGSSAIITLFYSEPEGYKNTLLCYLDNDKMQVKYMNPHMALIQKQFLKKGTYELKAVSILKNEDAMQILNDSVIKKIIVY
jgi:hypothetical protein